VDGFCVCGERPAEARDDLQSVKINLNLDKRHQDRVTQQKGVSLAHISPRVRAQ
jgi:hypothetical protein